jgi:hypothetical protein
MSVVTKQHEPSDGNFNGNPKIDQVHLSAPTNMPPNGLEQFYSYWCLVEEPKDGAVLFLLVFGWGTSIGTWYEILFQSLFGSWHTWAKSCRDADACTHKCFTKLECLYIAKHGNCHTLIVFLITVHLSTLWRQEIIQWNKLDVQSFWLIFRKYVKVREINLEKS